MVVVSQPAALNSHAGFGKRCSGRFLHEIIKNNSRSHGNSAGDKACEDEHAHYVSPVSRNYLTHDQWKDPFGGQNVQGNQFSIREGNGLYFDVHESSPKRADASVKVS